MLDEIGIAALNKGDGGLPAPRELNAVILARVTALSGATQSFLGAASVLGQHSPVSMITTVAELPDVLDAVDAAVKAGLMSEGVVGSELSFTHPLYRAAIYADLSPTHRQMLHAVQPSSLRGTPALHTGLRRPPVQTSRSRANSNISSESLAPVT